MASLTIENYVKAIYQLCAEHDQNTAATGKLAETLAVSPGTVTSMLKTLGESGLAEYVPHRGARLTDAGRSLALRVLRRHRLIELFLTHTLKLTWDEVHAEAENMEHAVSDLLVDRIDAFLGYPASDPHGDPIPKADGTIAAASRQRLVDLQPGDRFRITRVTEQSPEFLRYLSDAGLPLGAEGVLAARHPEAGTAVLKMQATDATLALDVAERILVEKIG